MRFVLDLVRARERDFVRRRFEIAFVVSLIVHALALWAWLPREPLLTHGEKVAKAEQPLTLRLTPSKPVTPEQPKAATVEAPPAPAVRPPPRPQRVAPRSPPSTPIMTSPQPAPPVAVPPPPPPTPPPPAPQPEAPVAPPPPMAGDLAAYIAERRRARGESGDAPATVDSDAARRDRAIAQNLASLNSQTFGELPRNGGGTFQIRRLDYDDAQFTFYGWNKDINRRAFQVIDVRKGSNPTIELAIVRKIIAIIRDYEPGDFHWESKRLGREMTLSARQSDNAELENFMMQEFFTAAGRAR